ncbi:hypothetical protein ACRAWD_26390 [Caulobacter segnis]
MEEPGLIANGDFAADQVGCDPSSRFEKGTLGQSRQVKLIEHGFVDGPHVVQCAGVDQSPQRVSANLTSLEAAALAIVSP